MLLTPQLIAAVKRSGNIVGNGLIAGEIGRTLARDHLVAPADRSTGSSGFVAFRPRQSATEASPKREGKTETLV